MKVLFVGRSYHAEFARDKLYRMAELGNQITVIQPTLQIIGDAYRVSSKTRTELKQGVRFISSSWFQPLSMSLYTPNLARLVREICRVDVVMMEEDPHSIVGIVTGLIAYFARKKIFIFFWDNLNRVPSSSIAWLIKKACVAYYSLIADGFIAGSEEAFLKSRDKGFSCRGMVLPLIGVPKQYFSCPSKPDYANGGQLKVCYAGRLIREKGITSLINAIEELDASKVSLDIIGGGIECELICKRISNKENINYRGFLKHEELMREFRAHVDVLVLPSLTTKKWKEQFGLVLIQAMASGCAVVGSDSGAIPEVIGDKNYVYPEGDHVALAKILQELHKDRGKLFEYKKACYSRALETFASNRVALAYSDFLKSR